MIDSGTEQNLISSDLIAKLSIPAQVLQHSLAVVGITEQNLTQIQHKTVEVHLISSGNHHEASDFFIFDSPETQLILEFPWLQKHNPRIDWVQKRIEGWCDTCLQNYLWTAASSRVKTSAPLDEVKIGDIPLEYCDLASVFGKQRALSLPPHRPYYCVINLLPGSTLPSSRLYNISGLEREAMKKYCI